MTINGGGGKRSTQFVVIGSGAANTVGIKSFIRLFGITGDLIKVSVSQEERINKWYQSLWEALNKKKLYYTQDLFFQEVIDSQSTQTIKLPILQPGEYDLWKMRMEQNKPEIEILSLDELFNNLKAYESEVKGTSSSTTNSHNVAFLSSSSTNSATRAVNTAQDVNTASTQGAADSSTTVENLVML
ncbi:hypothetical protein Tco_1033087 [Tanacetum coccineum]|uniref:Uncharacterized protein n=1 Tax=Tanacetum coccineum TaxID=301880 RepID=A0ABQ5GDR4_9ASTR